MPCCNADYCKDCMKKWSMGGSLKSKLLVAYTKNRIGINAATFFDDTALFKCPTCRSKMTYAWPSLSTATDKEYPKQVIAYLKYANNYGVSYITETSDLTAHIPKRYRPITRCPETKKIGETIEPIWMMIMDAISKEIEAGRTDFHWVKCTCSSECDHVFLASKDMKPLPALIKIPDIKKQLNDDTPPCIVR
eukprot:12422070-Karenia_brevis.AAC.1